MFASFLPVSSLSAIAVFVFLPAAINSKLSVAFIARSGSRNSCSYSTPPDDCSRAFVLGRKRCDMRGTGGRDRGFSTVLSDTIVRVDGINRRVQGVTKSYQPEAVHGMPWRTSIGDYTYSHPMNQTLLYMPYWEWQIGFMSSCLTNLRRVPCTSKSDDGIVSTTTLDFSYRENISRKARVVNACFASDEYRKIRMTYYDSGDKAQVFNSLWYPDTSYDVPVLGIDLLAFNRKKYLTVIDFQPLFPREDEDGQHRKRKLQHVVDFEEYLQDVYQGLPPVLRGRMSSRFYDENRFFSKVMLFGRFEADKEDLVRGDLFGAFRDYVGAHVDMVKNMTPKDTSEESIRRVLSGQAAYDAYSAERDPAHALFTSMFGKKWADGYVYDFLFDLSGKGER